MAFLFDFYQKFEYTLIGKEKKKKDLVLFIYNFILLRKRKI